VLPYGALLERAGNRGPTAAPQNLYRTNEIDEFGRADCWVAVAVATDEQWAGLCDALGQPAWAAEFSTTEARRAHHDVIDEHIASWCGQRSGQDIVEELWSHGVHGTKVG
jgi:crotonobetainyl-CoA:carnitine CoA-transferase CaiB-like acyl-CoA transferase